MAEHEPCPNCGKPVMVKYGPDIRFDPPCSKPMMWRAECSGDCLTPSYTTFTRDAALDYWDTGIRRARGVNACPAATDMGGNWCGDRSQCMEHCGSAIGGVKACGGASHE